MLSSLVLLAVTGLGGPVSVRAAETDDAACVHSITAQAGDTCLSLTTAHGMTVSQFLQINTAVHSCTLTAGVAYCIGADATIPDTPYSASLSPEPSPPSSVTSATAPTPPSSPTDAPPAGATGLIPSPDGSDGVCGDRYTCAGSVYGECCSANGYCGNSTDYCGAGCNPAYGQCGLGVGDGASGASTAAGVASTVTDVYTMTSTYVSTSTITALVTVTLTPSHTTLPATPVTSSSSAAASTFPGVASNCIRWYRVKATDNCLVIAFVYRTSQALMTSWNPGHLAAAAGLYICVGVSPVRAGGLSGTR